MMDKRQLFDIFSAPYHDATWQDTLKALFGANRLNLFLQPQPIELPANDKAEAAFELGHFTTADDRLIGLYKIEVKPKVWLERNKVGLRRLLRSVYKYDVDGALIVFVQQEKWRLSFVSEIKVFTPEGDFVDQVTEPKRFTYLLGKGEKVRTPAERLAKLAGKPLALQDLLDAFSVEALNQEFYRLVQEYFYRLVGGKVGKGKQAKDYGEGILRLPSTPKENRQVYQEFAVRLIGRTVFCWFLKMKKSDAGLPLLPEELLSSKAVRDNKNYYHSVLERIFFQMLNTAVEQRPQNLPPGAALVPFLNGGLFEPGSDDYYKPNPLTGLSENLNTLTIEDAWFEEFFQELEKYNFTIDENTITDVEVSVDPEMLGRIFENLLAEIDPETGKTARNATGSFYTPREVVDYMATESLVHYLHHHTRLPADRLRLLFTATAEAEQQPFTPEEKETVLEALDQVKILDPACGSGAFPMGVLQKIVQALQNLDPDAQWWIERQVNKNTHPAARRAVRQKLQHNPDYARKIGIIQNSLYGVDIQAIATEIAKLRCFLTLVVDEDITDDAPNRGIEPLPNLEFKFVTADALIALPKENNFGGLFNVNDQLKQLEAIRAEYLQSHGEQKKQLKERFKSIQDQLLKQQLKQLGGGIDPNSRAYKISTWKPFGHEKADWFDPEWMFGVKAFDIVIGNPPYVQLQKAVDNQKKLGELYKDHNYRTFTRTGDIYCLFYERGMQLLKEGGLLCYITSNKWMRAGYGEKLRAFFTQYNPLVLIDLGPNVFESATVDTNILIIQKAANKNNLLATTINESKKDNLDISRYVQKNAVILSKLTQDAWFIGSDAEQRLKEKIERIGKPLKDWDVNIYYGIKTGLNEAFIISTEKRNEILANCQDEEERKRTEAVIKPILRGRDIKRYYYDWAGLWVIVIPAGWTNAHKGNEDAENFIQRNFSSLMKNLMKYEEKAKKRYDQGDYWWELRHCDYYQEFEKEKVVWQELAQGSQFSIDEKGEFFVSNTAYILTGKCLKYILGYLNSKLNEFTYERWYCTKLGEKGTRWLNQHVIEIPLPPITSSNRHIVNQIEQLVDKILAAKKQDKNADTTNWEREIDNLVYRLYELTDEEVKIIENQP